MRQHKTHRPRPGDLFARPERPADAYVAEIDGASRGNPGPAAYAVILYRPDGDVLKGVGQRIGFKTNNEAEYHALIAALDYATTHGISKLHIRSDSQLLVCQMQGLYKVKKATLRSLHQQAQRLARQLASFSIEHVQREMNLLADDLANQALDHARKQRLGAGEQRAATHAPHRDVADPVAGGDSLRIRARYEKGVLRPAEPLDLDEGAEVEITIHPRRRN